MLRSLKRLKYLPKYRGRSIWRLIYGSKWVAAGALIFDREGRVLLIKHRWRGGWEYPVGMTDGEESPRAAAIRELREEVGLDLPAADLRLIAVDFFNRKTPNGNLVFTFVATIPPDRATLLKLDPLEATDYRWVTRVQAAELVPGWLSDRLQSLFQAYDAGVPVYLENGRSDRAAPN